MAEEREHNPFQSYDDDDIFGDDGAEDLHGPMEDLSLSKPDVRVAGDNGGDPLFGDGAGGGPTNNEKNPPSTATAATGGQGQRQVQQSIGGGPSLMEQLTGAPSVVVSHRTSSSGGSHHVTPPTPPPSRNTSNASAAGPTPGGTSGNNKSSLLASLTGGGGEGDDAGDSSHLFGIGGDTDDEEEEEDLFGAVPPVVKSPPPQPQPPATPAPAPAPAPQPPAAAAVAAAASAGAAAQPPPPSFYRSHDPGMLQQGQQGGQWGGGGGGGGGGATAADDPLRNMNVRGDTVGGGGGGGGGGDKAGINHYEYRPAMNLPDPVPAYRPQRPPPPPQPQQTVPMSPNPRAGLHVPAPAGGGAQRQQPPPPPAPKPYVMTFEPLYDEVAVSDPTLVKESGGMFGVGAASHWSYAVRSRDLGPEGRGTRVVQRRFRHFVALEGRLRSCCPGAILPPRPEKHATRAIEEGQAQQSLGFARARARELDRYLHALVRHPIAGSAEPLRFFLSFFDDLGTAWPEVSPNALTRLTQNLPWGSGGAAGAGGVGGFGGGGGGGFGGMASSGILGSSYDGSESMWAGTGAGGGGLLGAGSQVGGVAGGGGAGASVVASATSTYSPTEENAELLALHHTENIRLTQVSQCVPKLEGAITLLKQHNLAMGTAGMEFSKLSKDIAPTDQLLSRSVDVLAVGMLRSARRMKRLSAELGGAIAPFVHEYKLVPMERAAFQDRRNALQRRHTMRQKADAKAQKLMLYQNATAYEAQGALAGEVEKLQLEASESDDLAVESMRQAEEIGNVLQGEVARLKQIRTSEWLSAMKIVAESMKVASEEQRIIWEGAREQYKATFPDMAARDQQQE